MPLILKQNFTLVRLYQASDDFQQHAFPRTGFAHNGNFLKFFLTEAYVP